MHPPSDGHAEGIKNFSKLPAHVNSVREGLLDFDHFLGLQAGMLIDNDTDEEVIPLSAYKPDAATGSQRAREREFVESAQALVKDAESAECREDWKKVFRRISTERVGIAHNSRYVEQLML
jgi:hypothetical protein